MGPQSQYTHICVYAYIFMCIYMYTFLCVYVYMCVCVHLYLLFFEWLGSFLMGYEG